MRFGKPRKGRSQGNYIAVTDEEQIDACIVTHYDPKSPVSEAYRTLRTNFQFATIQQKPKTLMVTSSVPGEGKTTTAVNMAVTLADSGMRVLLIDTDLRRPHVHHVLKMERGPGLADVLREGLDPREVIRPTRVENLWIISSGRVPPNPSELIGSTRMERLMGQLGGEFDIVICDAPSILVVTDPVLLATHVDSVIMVISANNARRETIVRAKKLLETAKAHVAGVVLNGLEATRRHYYYYYYYYEDSRSPRRRRWYHL
jgi:capsular exopolysaccharide synthesis family protein